MSKKRMKSLLSGLLTLLVLAGIMFLVLRGNVESIMNSISSISLASLLTLLALGMGYQLVDAAMCMLLVRSRVPQLRYRQAFEMTFLGVFGLVTSGGAATIPMQSGYLYNLGLDVGNSVGLMILKYIFHKGAIFLYALALLLIHHDWISAELPGAGKYLVLGFGFCMLIILVLILICTWDVVRRLALRLIAKLPETGKWPGRKKKWSENIGLMYSEARHLAQNKGRLAAIIALNLAKLTMLYCLPYAGALAIGADTPGFEKMQLLASLMLLLSGVLPNVSGLGSVEIAFLFLFKNIIGDINASSVLVLYRIASYFFPFFVSIAVFIICRKKIIPEKRENNLKLRLKNPAAHTAGFFSL